MCAIYSHFLCIPLSLALLLSFFLPFEFSRSLLFSSLTCTPFVLFHCLLPNRNVNVTGRITLVPCTTTTTPRCSGIITQLLAPRGGTHFALLAVALFRHTRSRSLKFPCLPLSLSQALFPVFPPILSSSVRLFWCHAYSRCSAPLPDCESRSASTRPRPQGWSCPRSLVRVFSS